MRPSFFLNPAMVPSDEEIRAALGSHAALFDAFVAETGAYGPVTLEKRLYVKASGWCVKVLVGKGKKTNAAFVYPAEGVFSCVFTLGGKSEEALYLSPASDEVKSALRAAHPYQEGKTLIVESSSPSFEKDIRELLKVKFA